MTSWEAHAILDMDDNGYSESLGPNRNEAKEAWADLVTRAEAITGRRANATSLGGQQ